MSVARLGQAHLLADRVEDAQACAERAVALARARGERGDEIRARLLLGEIAARSSPPEGAEAEARCREALASAEELGMRPLAAHCHIALATLYRRTGQVAWAEERLSVGTTMYREMNMRFWLERVEAEKRALPLRWRRERGAHNNAFHLTAGLASARPPAGDCGRYAHCGRGALGAEMTEAWRFQSQGEARTD